jgi:hypothetical protein
LQNGIKPHRMILLTNLKKSFFVLCILYSFTSYGQKSDSTKFDLWVDAGIGAYGASSESGGFSPILGINLYHQETLYRIRYTHAYEFNLLGPSPSENLYSYGALLGKGVSTDKINLIFSAGLGITTGIIRGDLKEVHSGGGIISFRNEEFEKVYVFTPSIPLEVDMLFKATKFFGLNFTLFADFNLKRPYLGWAVKLSIGKLK